MRIKNNRSPKIILIALFVFLTTNFLYAQETVTFRTDRDTYIAGESVWIQANCLKSGTSLPSDLSKVIYFEVLNFKNVPVKQIKLFAKNGSTATQLVLPDTLSTGNYIIRAYTKWMRNYNVDFYFSKNIAVINPFAKNSFPKADKVYNSDTLIFYPEGGKIIRNKRNKLIAQSFDNYGNCIPVSGEIISLGGEKIIELETSNEGYAVFHFTPDEPGTYLFRFADNLKPRTIALPRILEKGINLQLENETNNNLIFNLAVENSNSNISSEGVLHIIHSNGIFLKRYPVLLKNNEKVTISGKSLPSGFLSALLINNYGEVVSSRYFEVSQSNRIKSLSIETEKKSYTAREPVSVKLINKGGLKNISVSVVKDCLLNSKTQIGKSASPNTIPFQTFEELANNDISINDLLLCFSPLENVMTELPDFSFLPEINGEIISGTIMDLENMQAVDNKTFILNFVGKNPTIDFSLTDSLGRFNFVTHRYGEQEIVIQPLERDTSNLNYKVNLKPAFCHRYASKPIEPLFIEAKNALEINQSIINMQVTSLYQTLNSSQFLKKEVSNAACFYGEPEISILTGDFIELPTMEEIFREIVPNTHLIKNEGKFIIQISEDETLRSTDGESFCMVDGVPIRKSNNILKMSPGEVEKIDVVNYEYFVKSQRLGTLLNVTTNSGDMSAFRFDSRLFRQVYYCYSPTYLFTSPDYSLESTRNSRIPDFRNLLYWNPNLTFNVEQKANVSFYTSDEYSKYTIIAEGINNAGVVERHVSQFEVKE
ncbi:MAG: hypothetical protein HN778_19140 [Prolixibacteraceae bacterium]|jgi:hypothetical protein|nr:hypothetical protein [Prolixibacteraceae bacterium]MBT6005605.1 hypothetical protein [Prolixibacteraceae bacterium]MBT6765293.1 hypothetical protein [Prolixibacteraceae bacterium]MBT6996919.1 hypothetical protein [Prolixibacteraceae bacterium]MBT7396953.1 hypothetical protein [Prolixibacteraceae bacterium]